MPQACEQTRVIKKFLASQPGALKLARRYGKALVCVRYRQSLDGSTRYTTVELLVEQVPTQKKLPALVKLLESKVTPFLPSVDA